MTGLSLALANLKPGTGKTTSAVWLAHIFVQAGNSVLLVDADPSGSALEWADLAAMDPRLAPPQAAFPFRVVALPSRDLHRRLPEIAQADDVVIIDTPQLEDHAAIALSALRYADQIVIPCAPSPIEINRTTPVREEITEVAAARDRPARSAVLLNRCVARAHSTADAREALASLDYDVLGTAVPRLEVYAQSFGRPVPGTGRQVWRRVARDLIERCPPPCPVRSGPPGHHPAQATQDQPRPESRALPAAHAADLPAPINVPHRRVTSGCPGRTAAQTSPGTASACQHVTSERKIPIVAEIAALRCRRHHRGDALRAGLRPNIHRSHVDNCLAPTWAQSLPDLLAAHRINGIWAGNWGRGRQGLQACPLASHRHPRILHSSSTSLVHSTRPGPR